MENEVKTKKKKSIFKKWWFWVIIGVVAIAIIGTTSSEPTEPSTPGNNDQTNQSTSQTQTNNQGAEKNYQKVDLQSMIDELNNNALRAEATYQNAYIEFTGKISNIDSDGSYVSIEPSYADTWNFDSILCYIKNNEQKNFIIQKSIGDEVTIKGQITSIGEILGYSLNIDSIS